MGTVDTLATQAGARLPEPRGSVIVRIYKTWAQNSLWGFVLPHKYQVRVACCVKRYDEIDAVFETHEQVKLLVHLAKTSAQNDHCSYTLEDYTGEFKKFMH